MNSIAYARSSYFLLSPASYRTATGQDIRLGYCTRTATLFSMTVAIAGKLEADQVSALSDDEVKYLAEIEAIVPAGEDELTTVLARMRSTSSDSGLRRMTIMPTAYCNMTCSYCGQEHRKSAVRQERVQKVIKRANSILCDSRTKSLSVVWFGGEPLLALRIIRELSTAIRATASQREKSYSASLITNGSLLTERMLATLYDECQVRWIEVTLDGPGEVHDRRRSKRNGRGSYTRIVDVLSTVIRSQAFPQMNIGIRVNVDVENESSVPDLIAELARHGLGDPRVQLRLAPVHSWGNDVSAVELEAHKYATREAEWLRLADSLGVRFMLFPVATKASTCIATTRSGELLDPDGGVYSCSEHPLVPRDRETGLIATVDNLVAAQQRPAGAFDSWYDEVQQGGWPCAKCAFLPVCGGGCPKLWREGALPCPSFKFNWPDRLDMAATRLGLISDG
jgi:uncharacterized protein